MFKLIFQDRNLDPSIGRKSTRNVNHAADNFFKILIIYTCPTVLLFKLKRKQLQQVVRDQSTPPRQLYLFGSTSPRHWRWTGGRSLQNFQVFTSSNRDPYRTRFKLTVLYQPSQVTATREGAETISGKDSSEAQHTGQEAHFLRSIAKKLPAYLSEDDTEQSTQVNQQKEHKI